MLVRVFCVALCLFLVGYILREWLELPGVNVYRKAKFVDMVYGKAHRPFVRRALVPLTVRGMKQLVPAGYRKSISQSLGFLNEKAALYICPIDEEHLIDYGIAVVLMYASLLGFAFSFRYLFTGLYDARPVVGDALLVFSLCGLPYLFSYVGYIYDFPCLFLFTLGFALMVRSKWAAFMVVFVLACLNKETAVLLTMVFFIHFRGGTRMGADLFRKLLVLQLSLYAVIEVAMRAAYRSNPGQSMEFHLLNFNIGFIRAYPFSAGAIWAVAAILVAYKWRDKPRFLKDGLWLLPLLFFMVLFFGMMDETRVYYEVYPVVLLLIFHTVYDIFGIKVVRRDQPALAGMPA